MVQFFVLHIEINDVSIPLWKILYVGLDNPSNEWHLSVSICQLPTHQFSLFGQMSSKCYIFMCLEVKCVKNELLHWSIVVAAKGRWMVAIDPNEILAVRDLSSQREIWNTLKMKLLMLGWILKKNFWPWSWQDLKSDVCEFIQQTVNGCLRFLNERLFRK